MEPIRLRTAALLLALGACLAPFAVAQSSEKGGAGEGWNFVAQAYLWGANIGMTMADGSSEEIRFTDIVDNLGFAFMGVFAAQHGKWTLLSDIIYLDIDDDIEHHLLPGVELKNLGMKSWVVTPLVGYRAFDNDKLSIDLLGGGRYLWIEIPLEFRFSARSPRSRSRVPNPIATGTRWWASEVSTNFRTNGTPPATWMRAPVIRTTRCKRA
jgi:hypothetical protein